MSINSLLPQVVFKDESFVKGLPGGMWNTKISGNLVNYLNWMLQVIDVEEHPG